MGGFKSPENKKQFEIFCCFPKGCKKGNVVEFLEKMLPQLLESDFLRCGLEEQNISWESHKIRIFPDYTRAAEMQHQKFRECKRRLLE